MPALFLPRPRTGPQLPDLPHLTGTRGRIRKARPCERTGWRRSCSRWRLACHLASPRSHDPLAPVRMGMPASMFRDVNAVVFAGLARPFYRLVEMQTGLKSELLLIPTPDEMREQLISGKLQLGVFHGFEFAWMKQKSPTLEASSSRPRSTDRCRPSWSSTRIRRPRRWPTFEERSSPCRLGRREYVRLFIARECQALGKSPDAFFDHVTKPLMPDTSMHEVVDATKGVQAAIVDGGMFQSYASSYSGRAKRLRVLLSSENFPESVVAYVPGKVEEDILRRFRQGMTTAHATPLGRQLLALWSMAGFQPIPLDYPQQLAECLKNYPPAAEVVK